MFVCVDLAAAECRIDAADAKLDALQAERKTLCKERARLTREIKNEKRKKQRLINTLAKSSFSELMVVAALKATKPSGFASLCALVYVRGHCAKDRSLNESIPHRLQHNCC